LRQCRQALVRTRYLIILNVWGGHGAREIQERLHIHNTTVYRVVERFQEQGEAALWDGRENNGPEKLSEHYLAEPDRVVRSNAQDHGGTRPAIGKVTSRPAGAFCPTELALVP
jgi:transposase